MSASRKRKFVALGGGAAAVVAGPLMVADEAGAASFEVTNLNDSGAGSLRQAVVDANGAAGPDVITFQSGLTGTIALTSGELHITDSVTISGPGAAVLTVSGEDTSRVFYLYNNSSLLDVTISGLTVANGASGSQPGGAIDNVDENLSLSHLVLDNNNSLGKGGALASDGFTGTLTISDTTFSNNTSADDGGGIYIEDTGGPTLIERTVITGNHADGDGGGVFFYDPDSNVTIIDSTISNNTTDGDGGGIYLYDTDNALTLRIDHTTISGNHADSGYGGGIFFYEPDGPVIISDSTISGNAAGTVGGGIFIDSAGYDFTIEHSTIVGNSAYYDGGGLASASADITINDSILADNTASQVAPTNTFSVTAASGADIAVQTAVIDSNFSLVEATDVVLDADNITGVDPMLGALANNGGLTQTHLPAPGSPVIDAGDPAVAAPPATDQRGMTRIVNSIIDIGSVEVAAAVNNPPIAVNDNANATAGGTVTITVLGNDSDPESNPLTITGVTQGTKGTVTINGGTVVYHANPGTSGIDTFTYTISDGVNSVTATVTVTIAATPLLPPTGNSDDTALIAAGLLAGGVALTNAAKRRRPA